MFPPLQRRRLTQQTLHIPVPYDRQLKDLLVQEKHTGYFSTVFLTVKRPLHLSCLEPVAELVVSRPFWGKPTGSHTRVSEELDRRFQSRFHLGQDADLLTRKKRDYLVGNDVCLESWPFGCRWGSTPLDNRGVKEDFSSSSFINAFVSPEFVSALPSGVSRATI
jgi:hypothetical protein